MLGQKNRRQDKKKSRTKTKATTARQSGRENKSSHRYQGGNYLKAFATTPTNHKNPATIKVSGAGSRKRTKTETKKR